MEELFSGHASVTPQFRVVQTHSHGRTRAETTDGDRLKTQTAGGQPRREVDARDTRTVFVGNLPPSVTRRKLKHLFSPHGKVESVRLRSIVVEKGKLPVRVAKRKQQQICSSTINAYVVFTEDEHAQKALTLNGALVSDRHIRVDLASRGRHHGHARSVFIGGLPFSADEEEVRELFTKYGDVEAVRVVREQKTGTGKGFGFVTYSDTSGVIFALQHCRGLTLNGQKLRVTRSKDMSRAHKAGPAGRFSGVQAKKMKERKGEGKKRTAGSVVAKKRQFLRPKVAISSESGLVREVGDRRQEKRPVTADASVRPSRTFHKKKEARRREKEQKMKTLRTVGGAKGRLRHKPGSQKKSKL